jgi:hypothetical protein
VFIENVPDLARHRAGKTLQNLVQRLARPARGLSYKVQHQVYARRCSGRRGAAALILAVRNGGSRETLPAPGPDLAALYAALRPEIFLELKPYLALLEDPRISA